jgi:hypothetical protein
VKGARMDIVHTIKCIVVKILKMMKGDRKPKPPRGPIPMDYVR